MSRSSYREDEDYDEPEEVGPQQQDDALSSLIPYKNSKALTAYYCGVFSLIPCLGLILGPIALIFGISGLRYAKEHPQAKGQAHAVVGIVLGTVTTLFNFGAILFGITMILLEALVGNS